MALATVVTKAAKNLKNLLLPNWAYQLLRTDQDQLAKLARRINSAAAVVIKGKLAKVAAKHFIS